jgi:[ribosomal protein S5]-alanine N-acetyltransferase
VAPSGEGGGPAPLPRPPELSAQGERVHVRTVRAEDDGPYRRAVRASAARMSRWNPVNLDDLLHRLATQSADNRTFFVFANEPVGDHDIVGRINLFGAVRGRLRSITMGYDSYDPYAGRGLFADGLRLVVDLAFADVSAGGMDLHRVEANVQPGNVTSAGLLRSLGFRHEGASPRLLFLPDDNRQEAWRDHERYALTREEWPAQPYGQRTAPRLVALLDDEGTASGRAVARALARELGLPLLPVDLPGLVTVVADCPQGAVVTGPLSRPECARAVEQLRAAEPASVLSDGSAGRAAAEVMDPRAVTRLALALRADHRAAVAGSDAQPH